MSDAKSRFAVSTERADTGRSVHGGSTAIRASLGACEGTGAPAVGGVRLYFPTAWLVGCLTLLALVFTVFAGSADAAWVHKPGPTFQMQTLSTSQPGDIAVDEATGSVYVMALNNSPGDIEKFDAAGNKSNFSGLGTNVINTPCGNSCMQIAVDNSGGPNQGTIYVSTNGSLTNCCPLVPNITSGGIEVYSPAGALIKVITIRSQFEQAVRACGIAVDSNGDLVVPHAEGSTPYNYIDRLDVQSWTSNPTQEPPYTGTINSDVLQNCKVAVDSAGTVYTQPGTEPTSTGAVRKFLGSDFGPSWPTGDAIPPTLTDFSSPVETQASADLATDKENFLYTTRNSVPRGVRKFDQAGSLIETFGTAAEILQSTSVVKNSTTNTVYVTDRSTNVAAKDVHIYTAFKVPDSLTGKYAAVTQAGGDLQGETKGLGAGEVTECQFEYVTKSKFTSKEFEESSKAPCAPATPYGENETKSVSASIGGLTLEEPYVFRLVTKNSNGTSNGTVKPFVPHAVIGLTTEPATGVGPRSATLNASFTGNGNSTEYSFEYGKTDTYGLESGKQTLPSPSGSTAVGIPVENLALETTYHYRAVAKNSTGTSKAFDGTFTTPPAVPGVVTKTASDIGIESITLNGEFNGDGNETTYYYEYGTDPEYGIVSPTVDAGSPTGVTQAPLVIDQFEGYSTYHYRLVAENKYGKTFGADRTFSTPAAPLPELKEISASAVAPTSATLSADVNPNRWATIYLFEWGPTTEYGSSTSLENTVGGLGDEYVPVSSDINGLAPGTLYHYRAVAINLTGVTTGPDMTFFTPDAPRIESSASSSIGQTTAHLSALVLSNASPTTVEFEYGTAPGYGSSTSARAIGAEEFAVSSDADLAGLAPGTLYHYRAVGTNGIGTTYGPDSTFTTQEAPPGNGGQQQPGPKKCPKGKVRRKGKCVKKPKKKKQQHKSQGKRNG